jgi:hypothetical protein
MTAVEVLAHPYFDKMDKEMLPQPVLTYLKGQRPTPIQNPLQLSMPKTSVPKNSGSTEASSSRKGKRKL